MNDPKTMHPPLRGPIGAGYAAITAILREPACRDIVLQTQRPLRFNTMTRQSELEGNPLTDADLSRIRERIELFSGHLKIALGITSDKPLRPSLDNVAKAVEQVAHEHTFHPVAEFLGGLEWDRVPRLHGVALHALGNPSAVAAGLLVRFFVGAVARVLRPGCKLDNVLILVGPQGHGKSTFFSTIAGDYFSDTKANPSDKDALLQLSSAWIVEWAELASARSAKSEEDVKAFLSARVDTYRPPYGRNIVRVPRTAVVVATTNEEEFLTDATGNRRYSPVEVNSPVALDWLRENRGQLLAEAVARLNAGEQWWLTPAEEAQVSAERTRYEIVDPWTAAVADYVGGREEIAASEILTGALVQPVSAMDRRAMRRVTGILMKLGWRKSGRAIDLTTNARRNVWRKHRT